MATFQSKRVSTYWAVVLQAAEDAEIRFTLNSGNRTLAEQAALVRQKGLWSPRNPTGAAAPSRTAPHIREGREDHALDVDTLDGGNARLSAWLRSEGARVKHPIVQEPWHLEISIHDLYALYRRYRSTHSYPKQAREWIREYDDLVRRKTNKTRRRVLRRVMKAERKKYWGKRQYLGVYTALLRRSR